MKRVLFILVLTWLINLSPIWGQVIDTICYKTEPKTYKVKGSPYSTFHWMVQGGTFVTPNGVDSIKVRWDTIPGTYTLNVVETNIHGCVGDPVISKVIIVSPEKLLLSRPGPICQNTQVELIASGFQKYIWTTGDTTSSINISPKSTTRIGVKGIGYCSIDSSFHTITVMPSPKANFEIIPGIVTIDKNILFKSSSEGANNHIWNLNGNFKSNQNQFQHMFYDIREENIKLLVTNNQGCKDSIEKTISVKEKITIYLPSAFTPNGDGINDEYCPAYSNIKKYEIHIFDRWGKKLWESHNIDECWNGIYQGELLPIGVYTYIVYYLAGDESFNNSPNLLKGTITVLL